MGLLIVPILAFATSFYPQPFPDTIQGAPVIVRGKAGMNYSDWAKDDEGSKRIYTFNEIQVTEVLKGSLSANSVVIREMGGEKDGVGLHVEGTSHYQRGEDVVVLLRHKNSDGSYDVQGMMMGKYNVLKDSDGTEYLEGPGLHQTHPEGQTTSGTPKKWTIDALRQLIRSQTETQPSPSQSEKLRRNLTSDSSLPHSPVPSLPSPTSTSPAAPQLQPAESEESHPSSATLPALAISALGALGIFLLYLFLRKKK